MSRAAAPIDFYFEFSSPYGYIASQIVEGFERRVGRPVKWRPMLLGPVFKITGQPPLVEIPMKGEYSKKDFARSARLHKVPYRQPEQFPIGTVAALRAFYWVGDRDPAKARELAKALEDPAVKDRARREVEAAIAAGVFGSPFFVVDGEAFWGVDRMPMLEDWIRTGGW